MVTCMLCQEVSLLRLHQFPMFVNHHFEPNSAQKPAYHPKIESPRVQLTRHLYSLKVGKRSPEVVSEETIKPLASVCCSPTNHITVSPHIHITPEKTEPIKNDRETPKKSRKPRSSRHHTA